MTTSPYRIASWPQDLQLDPVRPFTTAQALRAGVSATRLRRLVDSGVVRRVVRGVFVGAATPETLVLRARALRLVVPLHAVVVDETAGWLLGASRILAPSGPHEVPPVHVFHRDPGCRLRTAIVASGERWLLDRDVEEVDGLLTTTALRTATDLGRLRHRDRAIAALDSLQGLGAYTHGQLLEEVARFRGYRGVVQLRALAPIADARSQSPGESALRLRWLDAGLPCPVPQHPVTGPRGQPWSLDLADPAVRYAAEYDGEEHHTLESDVRRDAERRRHLTEREGWTISVLRGPDVFGPRQQAEDILRRDHALAVARLQGRG